jgi:hypothetical protein
MILASAVRLGHEHVHVPAHDVLLAVAEQTFCGRIEGFDQTARVDDHDGVNGALEYGRQHLGGAIRRIGT